MNTKSKNACVILSAAASLLVLAAAGPLRSANAQEPSPATGDAVQGSESATNRLVFKKRPRRAYDAAADIQSTAEGPRVPQEKNNREQKDAIESSTEAPARNSAALFDRRAAQDLRFTDPRKDKKEKKPDDTWLIMPGSSLNEVLSVLGGANGKDDGDGQKDISWGWLADEVIAKDPHSILGQRKGSNEGQKTQEADAGDTAATAEHLPPPSFDRNKDHRPGLFKDPRDEANRREDKDKNTTGRERTFGERRDGGGESDRAGFFSRDLLVNDRDQEERKKEQMTSDDPNRAMRASAADAPQDEAAEKPAFPMIQSLLSDHRQKARTEPGTAVTTEYALKTPKPPGEDPASRPGSTLGARTAGYSGSAFDRPVLLGGMDTSGKIGGIFSPAPAASTYGAGVSLPPPPPPSPARAFAAPQWPSGVDRGALWSPGSGSRQIDAGQTRSQPTIPNNATLPETPYTSPGGRLSTGFPR